MQYKLFENQLQILPMTSFIAKDRVLSIKFIEIGNQFVQLISEEIPVKKTKKQNNEIRWDYEISGFLSTQRVTMLPSGQGWYSRV